MLDTVTVQVRSELQPPATPNGLIRPLTRPDTRLATGYQRTLALIGRGRRLYPLTCMSRMAPSTGTGKEPSTNVELRVLDGSNDPARKYATAYDIRDMDALGLAPTFRRRFDFLAMLGFSSTVVVAWQTTLATFSFALFNGGTGGLFCRLRRQPRTVRGSSDNVGRDVGVLYHSTHLCLSLPRRAGLFVSHSSASTPRYPDLTSGRFPTAGGQYQWTAECAPRSLRRLASYCTGWLCTLAWTTFVAGCAVIVG